MTTDTTTDPTILRGIEGLRAAQREPVNYQARMTKECRWIEYLESPTEGWGHWSVNAAMSSSSEWRRRPAKEEQHPTEAELVAALRSGKELREFTSAGHVATYQVRQVLCARDDGEWDQCANTIDQACANWFHSRDDINRDRRWEIVEELDKPKTEPVPCSRTHAIANSDASQFRVRSTVEPPYWHPWCSMDKYTGLSPDDHYQFRSSKPEATARPAPGSIITWQEAQRRVDAGLPVETPLLEGYSHAHSKQWFRLNSTLPKEAQSWTYRIPLQPSEPQPEPAATMTIEKTKEWLRANKDGVAVGVDGCIAWRSGESIDSCSSVFQLLLPATQTQLDLEKQLREVTAERDALAKALATERNLNESIKRCMRRIADEGKDPGQ